MVEQAPAFGLEFVAVEARVRVDEHRVVNYKYHFELPDEFPSDAWTTLLEVDKA